MESNTGLAVLFALLSALLYAFGSVLMKVGHKKACNTERDLNWNALICGSHGGCQWNWKTGLTCTLIGGE